jgi:hypothetical protein
MRLRRNRADVVRIAGDIEGGSTSSRAAWCGVSTLGCGGGDGRCDRP